MFYIAAFVTLAGAIGAMWLRNLVHCALFLAISFVGIAVLFLNLEAPFAAFAQLLVYVGAVAILILFAVLLTRGGTNTSEERKGSITGIAISLLAGGAMVVCIGSSSVFQFARRNVVPVSTRELGEQLMTTHLLPLETIAILLTAALLGAVILALPEAARKEHSK